MTEGGRSIAEIMAETVALYEIEKGPYRRYEYEATRFLNNRLKAAQDEISQRLMDTQEEISDEEAGEQTIQIIERLITLLSNIYLRLRPNVHKVKYLLSEEQFNNSTESVRNEVRSYNNIAKIFSARDLPIFRGLNMEDFRFLGAALGCVYEAEVNASLVQAARFWLGIPMPQYYCRHDNELQNGACVVYNNVDLNFYDMAHESLRNITLGQIQFMINSVNNRRNVNSPEAHFSAEYNLPKDIGDRITEFSRLRNEACHTGRVILEDRFVYMYNHFCRDMARYLPIFDEIRKRLSSHECIEH